MVWTGSSKSLTQKDDTITKEVSNPESMVILDYIGDTTTSQNLRINGDSSDSYSFRESLNGGADTTATNVDVMRLRVNNSNNEFSKTYLVNVSGEEKLAISSTIAQNTAGAANAPARGEIVSKYVQTGTINEINIINSQAGEFNINSNLTVLESHDAGDLVE